MNQWRIILIAWLSVCAACDVQPSSINSAQKAVPQARTSSTDWAFNVSEGLDAVLLAGAMSGDAMQSERYRADIETFSARMPEEALAALDRIGAAYAEPGTGLAGPSMAWHVSELAEMDTLHDVIQGLERAIASGAFEERETAQDFLIVLRAFADAGFDDAWRQAVRPRLEAAIERYDESIAGYDIIPEQERLLGRDLDDRIEVIVAHYNAPYGIRIQGQRFLTHHSWSGEITLRTAVHEMFHPPYDLESERVRAAAARLRNDPLMLSIVANADPAFGYTSFEAILNEDSTQALDKVVANRLGFAPDLGEYWRRQDGGMHLLAAAIYDAMIETGFAQSGGVYEDWLVEALQSDILSPAAVRARAASVVGEEAVAQWEPGAQ